MGGAPSDAEGAAIVAALERFLAETGSRPAPGSSSPWQRAALAEGVSARRFVQPPGPALDR